MTPYHDIDQLESPRLSSRRLSRYDTSSEDDLGGVVKVEAAMAVWYVLFFMRMLTAGDQGRAGYSSWGALLHKPDQWKWP